MLQLGGGNPCTGVLPSSTFRMAAFSRIWYNDEETKIAMHFNNEDNRSDKVDDHVVELELVANVFASRFANVKLSGCLDLICAIRPIVNSHFNLCSVLPTLNEKKFSEPCSEEATVYIKTLEGFVKKTFELLRSLDDGFATELWNEFQKAHNLQRIGVSGDLEDVTLSEPWSDYKSDSVVSAANEDQQDVY